MKKKKVISFSVWGTDGKYLDGIFKNKEKADEFYPGWTLRAYYQCDLPEKFVKQMQSAGIECIPKPYYRDPWFGLYWRFCPMYDDSSIERFIVRDTDSRLSAREADAVSEWIESGLPFHLMRDNRAHNIYICGGMWGSVPGIIPRFEGKLKGWMQTVEGYKSNPRTRFHGTDQDFLCQRVWPLIKNNHMAHIANHKELIFTGREKHFRVDNPGGYQVGT